MHGLSRHERRALGILGVTLLIGCADPGTDPETDTDTETETETDTDTDTDTEETGDPLGLDECPAFSPREPATLPVAGWDDPNDPELACALRALDEHVAERSIYCLGENGHGISESTLWHLISIRYLVHTRGVRVIATESDRAGNRAWNDYLRSNDPADFDEGFAGVTNSLADTVEQEAFIQGLADIQAELPAGEELLLTGYDIAVQPQLVRAALLEFITEVAPTQYDAWAAAFVTFEDEDMGAVDWLAAGDAAAVLLAQIEDRADQYIAATDELRYEHALVDAANLRDGYYFIHHYRNGNYPAGNATFRETGMVRNAEWLRARTPADQPILLIGHNRHCARDWIVGANLDGVDVPAVGTHLADAYDADYQVIAQSYAGGTYTDRVDGVFETVPFDVPPTMLEAVIANATQADALLIGTMPTGSWQLWQQSEIVVAEQFDMMVWLRLVMATTMRGG